LNLEVFKGHHSRNRLLRSERVVPYLGGGVRGLGKKARFPSIREFHKDNLPGSFPPDVVKELRPSDVRLSLKFFFQFGLCFNILTSEIAWHHFEYMIFSSFDQPCSPEQEKSGS
jgi:hypothetical protein